MATLVCDFPLAIPLADLELKAITTGKAAAFFRELEFNSLAKRLQSVCESPFGKQHFVWEGEATVTKKKVGVGEGQMALF